MTLCSNWIVTKTTKPKSITSMTFLSTIFQPSNKTEACQLAQFKGPGQLGFSTKWLVVYLVCSKSSNSSSKAVSSLIRSTLLYKLLQAKPDLLKTKSIVSYATKNLVFWRVSTIAGYVPEHVVASAAQRTTKRELVYTAPSKWRIGRLTNFISSARYGDRRTWKWVLRK